MRPCSSPCRHLDPRRALALGVALAACRGQPAPAGAGAVSAVTSDVTSHDAAPGPLVACLAGAPPVVARVGGEPVRLDELAPEIGFRIYQHQVDVYGLLGREVERVADARLLAAAARRQGTTPEELVRRATDAAPPVGEADVDRYLREHPAPPGLADARARTRAYLVERGREQARLDLSGRLRREAGVELLVPAPEAPRIRLDLTGAPARGPADAPVTIVHFASFSSAASARSAAGIERLVREHPADIRWVHRTQLSPYDERGLRAAAAAIAVAALGPDRFWLLHDRLFALGGSWTDDELDSALRDLGVPRPAAALVSERLADVKRELGFAAALGLEAPPVVFVNGRYFSPSFSPEDLERLVREELATARR